MVAALAVLSKASAQEFPNVVLETIVKDAHYATGPVWSVEGFLLFSDTHLDQIKKWTPGKGVTDFASRAGGAAGNAFDDQGRLYTTRSSANAA